MHRTRIVVGALVTALVSLGVVAPAAEAAPPTVDTLTTSPTSLSAAGGSLAVKATVSGASTCVFTTTPDLGSSGSPVDCSGGTFNRTVTIPANTSTTDTKSYKFSVKAQNASGFQTRTLTLTQPEKPVPGPAISSLTVTPSSLTSAGGTVTIDAKITNGQTCKFTKDPALGGGTTTSSCTTSFSSSQSIPANTSTTDSKFYAFSLEVDNASGSASGSATVAVPPASSPAPSITDLAASPATFTSSGGAVSFTASVANATSCAFTAPSTLGGATTTSNCSSGTFSGSSNLPANTGTTAITYQFVLKASGPGGTATQTISLVVPPPSANAPAITAFTITPTSFTSDGGNGTLKATVRNATGCTFTRPSSLGGATTNYDCSGGSFLGRTTLPANSSSTAQMYTFTLMATGPGGTATASLTATVPAAGSSSGPTVGPLSSSPASISPSKASLTVSGTVSGASTCTFTSDPATLGLSTSPFDCSAGGTISRTVTIPSNNTGAARTYSFTLTANGAGGASMSRTITLTQNPLPPVVNPLTSRPTSIPAAGTSLVLSSKVARATSCVFSSSPDLGVDETPFACNGPVNRTVTVPANTTGSARTFNFGLTASGPGGTAGRGLTLTQPATSSTPGKPTATTLAFSPTSLTSDGGQLTVSSTVSGATSCVFSASPALTGGGSTSCTSGTVSSVFTVPANTTSSARDYVFQLVVSGPGGSVTKSYGLSQPPAAPTAAKLSFAPATLSADGGNLVVSSTVTGATSCEFSSSPVIPGGATKACDGSVSQAFTVPANTTGSDRSFTFSLKVTGPGGKLTRAFTLPQPAAA